MANEKRKRAREIFMAIADLPTDEREQALTDACGGDETLRAEVETLLAADAEAGGFLATPTADGLEDATADVGPGPFRGAGDGSDTGLPTATGGAHEAPGQVVDRYKLLQPIGEGGFGTVWMAEQERPVKRRVAIKIIKLGMDTKQVIARFEAERQALAMMDHPNIAKVLDAGATETGRPYFAMEYIRGVPIVEYCDTEKLDTKGRLDLFTQVCHAIQHAHQKGIIHRDIKPSNVLVTMHDGVPVPKVIDFGIAKATNTELTQKTLFTEHRQMIGTPAYMSPEQAEMSGLDIDTRSDIYALGVLLYELLTGTTPFTNDELASAGFEGMMRMIREVEPHKPSTRLSSLGDTAPRTAQQRRADVQRLGLILRGDLDWIVMKCLEKDRTRRYETANGLAADIRRHLTDEPVLAGPPSAGYKLGKFIKRNRGQVIAGGVIAAALVLGVVGTSFGMAWALSEKGRADEQAAIAAAAAEAETRAKVEAQENERRAIEEAGRAEAAEVEALARATELERVAEFQSEQLSAIEPEVMGIRLRRALLDSVPEDEREALAAALALVNFTNIALGTLEENIFGRTIEAIDTQFAEQPIVQARLLETAAMTLRNLGLYDLAFDPQQRALQIRRERLGHHDPLTLASINNLGALLREHGRYAEAERYLRESVESHRSVLGDDDPATSSSLNSLGFLLMSQGRLDEAEQYFNEALETRRRVQGEEHPDTLYILDNLGLLFHEQGRLAEAEACYRDSLDGFRRVFGDGHLRTLKSIGNLGSALSDQGKFVEAEPLIRETLTGYRYLLGDEHSGTLTVITNLGSLLHRQGRLGEAEPLYREAMETGRRTLGVEHPVTLNGIQGMGVVLTDQRRFAEAEPFTREVVEIRRRVLGGDHSNTLNSIGSLGVLLRHLGRLAEAEEYLGEAVDGLRRVLGGNHHRTLHYVNSLGVLYQAQGRLEEAEFCFRETLAGRRTVLGDEHPSTLHSISIMGRVLQSQRKLAEAEPYFRELLGGNRRVWGDEHPNTLSSISSMGFVLSSQGKLAEAEPYAREALEGNRLVLGDEHPNTLVSMSNYALLLADLKRGEEALALADEAVETGGRVIAEGHYLHGNFLGKRGRALQALGRYDEAAEAMLEGHAILTAALGDQHEQTRRVVGYLADLYDEWHAAEPDAGHDVSAAEWRAKLSKSDDSGE